MTGGSAGQAMPLVPPPFPFAAPAPMDHDAPAA